MRGGRGGGEGGEGGALLCAWKGRVMRGYINRVYQQCVHVRVCISHHLPIHQITVTLILSMIGYVNRVCSSRMY